MVSRAASGLKKEWMEMPVEWFEPLTFGELAVGEKFIILPSPGDEDGHGGFRGAYLIFTKSEQHGAVGERSGFTSETPSDMYVIRVK